MNQLDVVHRHMSSTRCTLEAFGVPMDHNTFEMNLRDGLIRMRPRLALLRLEHVGTLLSSLCNVQR